MVSRRRIRPNPDTRSTAVGSRIIRLDPQIVFMTERTRGRRNHIDRRDDRERVDRFLAEVGVDVEQCRDERDGWRIGARFG